MTQEEHDKDMIESIEMWLRENELQYVEKELAWLEELRTRLFDGGSSETPKDLEEAAEHYASVTDQEAHGIDFIREVFIAGAEWQKEQMLKEAVEKTVGQLERQWGGNIHFMHGFEVDEMDFPFLNSQECGYSDKVRVIVLPKEG